MGYIYEEVKKQMNGLNKRTGAALIQNWSPNLYRCIIISQSFIFMAKHIGTPVICHLDPMKVQEDLSIYARGQGRGSLHNLFSERQLSCLEEIYFDDIFRPFQNLFDINEYVKRVKNSQSRLRYYGYCRTGGDMRIANWLVGTFQRADVLYCLAKDKNRVFPLEYKEVGELGWYKNYNLRPQYYKLDADGGQLAIYFKKNERVIEDLLKKYSEDAEKNEKARAEGNLMASLKEAIKVDIDNLQYARKYNKIAMHAMKARVNDSIAKLCYASIISVIRKNRVVKGFNERILKELLKNDFDDVTINAISSAYETFMIYDPEAKKGKPEVDGECVIDKVSCGLINVASLYDDLCMALADEITKDKIQRLLIDYNLDRHNHEIPAGRFRVKYLKRDDGQGRSLDGYINFLSDVIGININTL